VSIDIYKARYEYVFGPISLEQYDFIENNIYCSDDGTYELSNDKYSDLKRKFGERDELKNLFDVFEREIKKGKGHFSFRVFG